MEHNWSLFVFMSSICLFLGNECVFCGFVFTLHWLAEEQSEMESRKLGFLSVPGADTGERWSFFCFWVVGFFFFFVVWCDVWICKNTNQEQQHSHQYDPTQLFIGKICCNKGHQENWPPIGYMYDWESRDETWHQTLVITIPPLTYEHHILSFHPQAVYCHCFPKLKQVLARSVGVVEGAPSTPKWTCKSINPMCICVSLNTCMQTLTHQDLTQKGL